MRKTSYQTYTEETPLDTYRTDFMRRGAMCTAVATRFPPLEAIGTAANAIVEQIDGRRVALQQAEDDQVRARAKEDAEKLDVVEIYTELRRTLHAKNVDVLTLLPDAPSTLGRLGAKAFGERMNFVIANLNKLPDGDPQKTAFLPALTQELAGFRTADVDEDTTRANLHSSKVALLLYKAELSLAREAQLGAIQTTLRDREKTALFTVPWRKTSKPAASEEEVETPPTPVEPSDK